LTSSVSISRRVRDRYRELVVAACGLGALAATVASGGTVGLDRLLYDLALAGHHALGANQRSSEPVAVVAIDRATLDAPELRDIPRVFMGPAFTTMLDATVGAGATAVGFDVIFAYDSTRFDPKLEAPFRAALERHGEKVVLGRSAQTAPALPILLAAPDDAIGFLELPRDPDGVSRRVPAALATDQGPVPTMTERLLARAGRAMPAEVRLAPAWHLETMPTYALIDVTRCAAAGDRGALERAFAGKVVLVGTTLAEEDRRLAPSRFIAPPASTPRTESGAVACRLERQGASDPDTETIPGVFIHAAAVESVLAGRLIEPAPSGLVAGLSGAAGTAGALIAIAAAPAVTVAALAAGVLALVLGSAGLLAAGLWLPTALAALALPVAAGIAYAIRFMVEERRRRWIQRVFGHYLAATVVDQLAAAEAPPTLGGERREVTVMFADLSGFTALSGRIPPQALMETTNRYLVLIAEEVERTGGYVDKFIGDAVMAIWGAPVANPRHAQSAVRATLAIGARMAEERTAALTRGDDGFWVKMGVNSGPAIVGNVGSPKRLAYTVVGETVNLAARFESLPGDYGCLIVIGAATAAALDGAYPVCELDFIKVKGKAEPVKVYEPFAATNGVVSDYCQGFARGLAAYRARRFGEAQQLWLGLVYPGIVDPKKRASEGAAVATPNRAMAARATVFLTEPPPVGWRGEWVRESK